MPALSRLPYGLSEAQRACLVAAVRTGLVVPRPDGRFRPWSAMGSTPSFQANLVATLVRRGLLERTARLGARAAQPTREGFALGWTIAREAARGAPAHSFDPSRRSPRRGPGHAAWSGQRGG